jgi:prepilin-type N-terminal cleavage/methylation domain-containing protein
MSESRLNMAGGYTLVELLIAMAIFSFMLVIIVAGFVNIIRLHNSSVSTNVVMDNSQTIMAGLERSIRDGATVDPTALAAGKLCIDDNQLIYVDASKNLQRSGAVNCIGQQAADCADDSDDWVV